MRHHPLSTLCLLLGLAAGAAAAGDDIKLYRSGESVNPQDVAAVLGGAHLVRVHAVAEMVQVVRVADMIRAHGPGTGDGSTRT